MIRASLLNVLFVATLTVCGSAQAEDLSKQKSVKQLESAIKEGDANHQNKLVLESLYELADLFYRQKQYGKAEPLMLRLVAIRDTKLSNSKWKQTGSPPYPIELACLYESTNRAAKAEQLLQHIIDMEKKYCISYKFPIDLQNLTDFYMRQGRWRDALSRLNERLALITNWENFDRADVEALHDYAVCAKHLGKYAEAVDRLEPAINAIQMSYDRVMEKMKEDSTLTEQTYFDPSEYKMALTMFYKDLGDCLTKLRKPKAAEQAYDNAKHFTTDLNLHKDPNL